MFKSPCSPIVANQMLMPFPCSCGVDSVCLVFLSIPRAVSTAGIARDTGDTTPVSCDWFCCMPAPHGAFIGIDACASRHSHRRPLTQGLKGRRNDAVLIRDE